MKAITGLRDDARTTLRSLIEMFEHQMTRFFERDLAPADRSELSALRDSWSRFVDVLALGPMERVRRCPSCRRSALHVGKRCAFCWNQLAG